MVSILSFFFCWCFNEATTCRNTRLEVQAEKNWWKPKMFRKRKIASKSIINKILMSIDLKKKCNKFYFWFWTKQKSQFFFRILFMTKGEKRPNLSFDSTEKWSIFYYFQSEILHGIKKYISNYIGKQLKVHR